MKLSNVTRGAQKTAKMSKAASKDNFRPGLQGVQLAVEKTPRGPAPKEVVLYATDSWVFARHVITVADREEIEAAAPGPIPLIGMQHIERGVEFDPGEDAVRVGLARYDRQMEGRAESNFPDYHKLKPSHSPNTFRVGVNAKLLHNLADALGGDHLTLEFDMDEFEDNLEMGGVTLGKTYLKAIQVTPHGREDGEGLIMPVRLTG